MCKIENEWRAFNKRMRQQHLHECQFNTLEEYSKYKRSDLKYTKEFETLDTSRTKYRRQTRNDIPSHDNSKSGYDTSKPKSQKYTGTLIKGISVMHKSNAVPVISKDEMKDHSKMGQ